MMGKNSKEFNSMASKIGLTAIAQSINKFKGIILIPILTKLLSPTDYGLWSLILISLFLIQPFILLGLDSAFLRFLSSKEDVIKRKELFSMFSIIFLLSIILIFVILISLENISGFFNSPLLMNDIILVSSPLIFFIPSNTLLLGSFRTFGKIKQYAIILISKTILEILLIYIFISINLGLLGAIFGMLITEIATFIILFLIIFRIREIKLPKTTNLKKYVSYGIPLIPTAIFAFVIASSDRYIIGFFNGSYDVGIYSAAYGIGNIIFIFGSYITYIVRPQIFRCYDQRKIEKVKKYLEHSLKWVFLFSIPSFFGLSILSKQILEILTTAEFVSLGTIIITLISLSTLFLGVKLVYATILHIHKKTKLLLFIAIFSAIMNLFLNIWLIPLYGIIMASITTLASYLFSTLTTAYYANRYLHFSVNFPFLAKAIVSSLIMSPLLIFTNPSTTLSLLLIILIGTLIYFSVLYLLKGISKQEIVGIINILPINRIKNKKLKGGKIK